MGIKPLKRGGTRQGAGRKADDDAQNLERVNIMLDAVSLSRLRAFGNGNLSLGVRRAAALTAKPAAK